MAPMRILAGWFEVFLGGTSSLLKAIGLHRTLLRACNVVTPALIAGRVPIFPTQILLQTQLLPLRPISIPASTPNSCPSPKHASPRSNAARKFDPACRERGAFLVLGKPQLFSSSTYPFFLSVPFIFPLVEIPFS